MSTYRELFVNRDDVFARQLESGAYLPQKRALTDEDIEEHLAGIWSIGTYVINPENQSVRYICWDLDTHDEDITRILCEFIEHMVRDKTGEPEALKALLKESSGGKGTHAWLFLSDSTPAAQVRAWVESGFTSRWSAVTATPIEVFPKQDFVTEGGFGNLIKLPLGRHQVSGNWSEILPYQGWASSIEEVVPLDVALVPKLALPQGRATAGRSTGRAGNQPASPFPCVDQIIHKGAGKGQRDNAMFHLAMYLFGHAVPEDLALEMCLRANENFDPPCPERDVERKVAQAYSGKYVAANCGSDWLRSFCEGPCKAGWTVKKAEGGALAAATEGSTVEVEVRKRSTERGRTRLTLAHPDAANEPTLIIK